MIKKILKSSLFQLTLSRLIAGYIWVVYRTTCWKYIGFENPTQYITESKSFLTCFWHGNLTMLPYAWTFEKPFHMLISAHKDGQLISKTVHHLGVQTVKGSTGKGGTQALRDILNLFKSEGYIGITPDGPRGPRHSISNGTITIAKLAKVDILPVTFSTKWGKTFKSWDHFFLPFPFSKGVIIWGDPIKISNEYSQDELKVTIKKALMHLQNTAQKMLK